MLIIGAILGAIWALGVIFLIALCRAAALGDRLLNNCPEGCTIPFDHHHVDVQDRWATGPARTTPTCTMNYCNIPEHDHGSSLLN